MSNDRWANLTRRAVLALVPWLCLATTGPGCSPSDQAPTGASGTPDRLDKMRALRGSGDPRRQGVRPSVPARQKLRPG
jgi:hypothetical protein